MGEQVQSGILSDEDVRNLTITSQDLEKVCLCVLVIMSVSIAACAYIIIHR